MWETRGTITPRPSVCGGCLTGIRSSESSRRILGGYERWEEARETLIGLPIWLDTSSALWAMSPEDAVDLIRAHGVDRVVFGTDYPVNNHARELLLFNRLDLTPLERQAILHDNGARLLAQMGCGLEGSGC